MLTKGQWDKVARIIELATLDVNGRTATDRRQLRELLAAVRAESQAARVAEVNGFIKGFQTGALLGNEQVERCICPPRARGEHGHRRGCPLRIE